MQVINTNIASLNSQRHLNKTQSALSTATERLSSGLRINNAKDDAAGLGISDRMTTQINGMNQAIRNARDGISMSQTAEGALSTSRDMLQRIRTLAVQSSNSTNASLDRQAIQDEVNELTAELNRIAQTTQFNGLNLLDGSMGTQHYQVGANAGELINSSGTNFLTNKYGTYQLKNTEITPAAGTAATLDANDKITAVRKNTIDDAKDITIAGYLGKQTVKTTAGNTALEIANLVNEKTSLTGVTAKAETTAGISFDAAGRFTIDLYGNNKDKIGDAVGDRAATISFDIAKVGKSSDNYAEAINAINAQSAKTGITAEYDSTIGNNGGIKLTHATGEDIVVKNATDSAAKMKMNQYDADGKAASGEELDKGATLGAVGQITYDSVNSFKITDASTLTSGGNSELKDVASLDLTSFAGAQLGIQICDSAINRIDKEMARYGALQSRFESTISNLEVNSENTSNARSRIQDADYAEVTAEYSRTTILQQAGVSMLAQANQQPQTVLSLIG